MLTKEEKTAQLHLSLDDKIKQSKRLIMDWYAQFKGKVYVAYSGGKDSTVLLHLVRSLYPEVPAVFCNTGLEYPDIVEFVKTTPNVEIIKPKLTFKQVLEKYGYPVISKEQSQYIYDCRHTKSCKQLNIRLNGNKSGRGCVSNKWKFLIDAPFKISNKCCDIMKKNPSKEYEKRTGRKPYLGKANKPQPLSILHLIPVGITTSSLGTNSILKGVITSYPAEPFVALVGNFTIVS